MSDDQERECETWALDDDGNQIPGTGMCWEGPENCEEEFIFGGNCFREKDHEGACLCYGNDGSLHHWNEEGEFDGMIPPGHEKWVSPVDLQHLTYTSQGKWVQI